MTRLSSYRGFEIYRYSSNGQIRYRATAIAHNGVPSGRSIITFDSHDKGLVIQDIDDL